MYECDMKLKSTSKSKYKYIISSECIRIQTTLMN